MKIKLNNQTEIDLQTLIDTRLLVQANSGGGKSWLLRRILEQSHGKVQQIILDLEGEFATLREKYDYVLAGVDGDTPAEPRSAALLAKRLLELNVSAVINLYELNHLDRKRFVKLFLDSMVNARKELWHPCLVVVDEAHVFCPEKGQAESAGSVIDLATRGRKRGYCAILATQRLSKLHKDAAAECNNKLIGRTGLDIDMKRAAEELGFTSKEQLLSLRSLEAGEFFAFGPAISNEVIKIKVGDVETTHPKAGSRILTAAPKPPTEKIREVLGKLADLPKEVKREQETIESLQRENFELKRNRPQNVAPTEEVIKKALVPYLTAWNSTERGLRNQLKLWSEYAQELKAVLTKMPSIDMPNSYKTTPESYERKINHKQEIKKEEYTPAISDKQVTGGAFRMLQVLASRFPMTFTKAQLATLSKLKSTSGTYGTYMSLLRSKEFIEVNGDQISITDEGLRTVGEVPQQQENTVDMWRQNLTGGAQRMFDYLIENYPQKISRDDLGEGTGLNSRSGTFGTYLSMLRSNGLIEVDGGGIKASENLFL